MSIPFTKMHGLGNDFVIIDATKEAITLTPELVRAWGNRHTGIGFDQLLIIEPPQKGEGELFYRIFNADGNQVEQCGNGARCFARYAFDNGLVTTPSFKVETVKGVLELTINDDGLVCVDMGAPILEPAAIPMQVAKQQAVYNLALDNTDTNCGAVSMGNPHCVLIVNDIELAPLTTLGVAIAESDYFPEGVNVGFMQIVSPGHIKLRVLERGVGETQACGSGACAAVVVGRLQQLLEETVNVELTGGTLSIAWQGNEQPVLMTGPASYVFNGYIDYTFEN